jgi:imidazolonepropionase-like amidohydrolase
VALRAGARLLVHSVWDAEIDDEFLRLARDNGAIYCPTLTVSDGYGRLMSAALDGQVPEIDDPHACVDASLLERIRETATLGAKKVERSALEGMRERLEARAAVMAANLRRVHEAGIPVAMGTDAGNPLTLHGPSVYAEMEAMQRVGLTAMQVLVATTRGGALAMGRPSDTSCAAASYVRLASSAAPSERSDAPTYLNRLFIAPQP